MACDEPKLNCEIRMVHNLIFDQTIDWGEKVNEKNIITKSENESIEHTIPRIEIFISCN